MENKFRFYALWICLICIIVFVIQILVSRFTDFFDLNSNYSFEIWRFFTSIFLHGGIAHLFYNIFALALFGSMLEGIIGSKKFLLVFIVTGVFANIISINFYSSSLGASGAIFGVIGTLIIVRPMLPIFAFGLPMPVFLAGILWVTGDLIGAASYLTGNPIDSTGNIAHLSGIFFGFIFGFIYRDWTQRKRTKLPLNEKLMRKWEDYYMGDI